MRSILYSIFGRTESSILENIDMLILEADNYKRVLKVPDVLHDKEREYLGYMEKCYNGTGQFPSMAMFLANYPEVGPAYAPQNMVNIHVIDPTDLRTYIFQLVDARVNDYIGRRIDKLNEKIKTNGITHEISDEISRLEKLSNRNKAHDVEVRINGKDNYERLKLRPRGMQTGIRAVDEKIGGMNEGTVTTIAGFTSQYKTTWAVNIAYLNSYYNGYNVVYISLETPKQDMYWNLLSRHSYEAKFSKYQFVGHDKMRRTKMNKEEEDYIFDVVEPDLYSKEVLDDGTEVDRGQVVILDESDFESFSFGEIQAVLEKVDEKLGGNLDAVIVDYAQLCKFSGSSTVDNETAQINAYVSFFRRLSQNFKKYRDADGVEHTKQLILVLLSQIRRDSWRKAVNHNGVYDITCMSDSSELEKSSFRILTTYTTEELKQRKIAQVQILKNRTGQTMQAEPAEVLADGEAYVFCDEDGTNVNTFAGNDQTASLSSAFDSLGALESLL